MEQDNVKLKGNQHVTVNHADFTVFYFGLMILRIIIFQTNTESFQLFKIFNV